MNNSEERVSLVSNPTRKGGCYTRVSKKASPKKKKTKKEPRFPTKPKVKAIDRDHKKCFYELPVLVVEKGHLYCFFDTSVGYWTKSRYGWSEDKVCTCLSCSRSYFWNKLPRRRYSYLY